MMLFHNMMQRGLTSMLRFREVGGVIHRSLIAIASSEHAARSSGRYGSRIRCCSFKFVSLEFSTEGVFFWLFWAAVEALRYFPMVFLFSLPATAALIRMRRLGKKSLRWTEWTGILNSLLIGLTLVSLAYLFSEDPFAIGPLLVQCMIALTIGLSFFLCRGLLSRWIIINPDRLALESERSN